MVYRDQFLEFISDRSKDKISDKEYSKIISIFDSRYMLSSDKYSLEYHTNLIKYIFIPKYIHKYEDDWWTVIMCSSKIPVGSTLPIFICDGLDGLIELNEKKFDLIKNTSWEEYFKK